MGVVAVYKVGKKGTYWIEFQFRKRRIRRSAKTTNKEVARRVEAQLRAALAEGRSIDRPPDVPTVAEFADTFRQYVETENSSRPETVAFYKGRLKILLRWPRLANSRLDEIGPALVTAYKKHRLRSISRRGLPLSRASINRELGTLRRVLGVAAELKAIEHAPEVRLLKDEAVRDYTLSPEDEERYFSIVAGDHADICRLLLDCALRLSEARCLEWPDVHLGPSHGCPNGSIKIRPEHKSRKPRTIPLTQKAAAMFRRRRAVPQKSVKPVGLVFPGKGGKPHTKAALDYWHAKARETLGLPELCTLHSMRHTALSRLAAAGAGSFEIMAIAGHRSIQTSAKYVHPSIQSVGAAIARMESTRVPPESPDGRPDTKPQNPDNT